MINCIAIDDEPLALEVIETLCADNPHIRLHKTFTDVAEAAKFIRKFPVDLLFLDIQMPDQNGIDFWKLHGQNKMVIFTTAFSDYAVEGFNVNAVDYLLKPIDRQRFGQACTKAWEYHHFLHASNHTENRCLFVRSEYSLVKIPFAEIEYIETLDDYIRIHQAGKKPVLTKMNLKHVMEKLDPREFVRVHRSYIISMGQIKSVRGKTIQLPSTTVPIGLRFEQAFFAAYTT